MIRAPHGEYDDNYTAWLERVVGGGGDEDDVEDPPMWVQINEQNDTYHVWYHIPTKMSIRLRRDGAWVANELQALQDTTQDYSFSLNIHNTPTAVTYGAQEDQKLDLLLYPDVRELSAKIREDPFYIEYLKKHNINSKCAKRSQEDCTATGCIWLDGRMQRWSECRNLEEVCREREKGKTGWMGILTDGVGGIIENSDNLARIEKMCHMDGLQERQRKYRIGTAAVAVPLAATAAVKMGAVAGIKAAAGTALTGAKNLLGFTQGKAAAPPDAAAQAAQVLSGDDAAATADAAAADPPPQTRAQDESLRYTDRAEMDRAVDQGVERRMEVIEARNAAAQAREEAVEARAMLDHVRQNQRSHGVLFGGTGNNPSQR